MYSMDGDQSSEVEMQQSVLAVTTNEIRVQDLQNSNQSEQLSTDSKSDLTQKKAKVFPSHQLGSESSEKDY